MSAERDTPTTTRFLTKGALPELTPGAAQVLLRILRKAHDHQLAAGTSPPPQGERDVA